MNGADRLGVLCMFDAVVLNQMAVMPEPHAIVPISMAIAALIAFAAGNIYIGVMAWQRP